MSTTYFSREVVFPPSGFHNFLSEQNYGNFPGTKVVELAEIYKNH